MTMKKKQATTLAQICATSAQRHDDVDNMIGTQIIISKPPIAQCRPHNEYELYESALCAQNAWIPAIVLFIPIYSPHINHIFTNLNTHTDPFDPAKHKPYSCIHTLRALSDAFAFCAYKATRTSRNSTPISAELTIKPLVVVVVAAEGCSSWQMP